MKRQSVFNKRRFLFALGLALILLAVCATWVLAQSDGVIYACVEKDGTMRIVTGEDQCKKSETLLSWNITGPQGPKGDTGDTGLQGPAGADGAPGMDGATGPQGPKGDTGDTGLQGPAGADGAPGMDGATGSQGPKGDTGDTGLQGPAGADGAPGIDGATGPQGPQGIQGETGPAGPASLAALQGTACTFGTYIGTLSVTLDSTTGAVSMVCVPTPFTLTISAPATWVDHTLVQIKTAEGNVVSGADWVVSWYQCNMPNCSPTILGGSWIDFFYVRSQDAYSHLICPDGSTAPAVYMPPGGTWESYCYEFTMDGDKTITLVPIPEE